MLKRTIFGSYRNAAACPSNIGECDHAIQVLRTQARAEAPPHLSSATVTANPDEAPGRASCAPDGVLEYRILAHFGILGRALEYTPQ